MAVRSFAKLKRPTIEVRSVTLIVTVNGPETIWVLADRRLSDGRRIVKEDARKVMFLHTTDGVAILGYAGLGSTFRGTEPSDWMSSVLRGRNLPIEECLGILVEAMKAQLPRHLSRISAPDHVVMIPAFVGNEATFYTLDLTLAPDGKGDSFNNRRWVGKTGSPPRFGMTGSGAWELKKDKDEKWARDLLGVIRAADRRQVSPIAVADELAKINYKVHLRNRLGPVGPRCIVAWRHRQSFDGGGSHQFYTKTARDTSSTSLPTIVSGIDLNARHKVMEPYATKMMEAMLAGQPTETWQEDEINVELARLPDKPDEGLH